MARRPRRQRVTHGARAANNPIAEANAGIVVPPEDAPAMAAAVRQLLAMTPAERWEMGLRGRAYVEEHFDTDKLAERLVTALEAL